MNECYISIQIPKEVDVTSFMVKNLIKPNPIPISENEEGNIIINQLLSKGFIEYKGGVAFTNIGVLINKEIVWWDNVGGTNRYRITKPGLDYLYKYRSNQIILSTNKSVQSTNKNTIRILIFATLISLLNLGIAIKSFIDNDEKEQLHTLLQSKGKLSDSLQSTINQEQTLINHLLKEKISKGKRHD